MSIAAYPKYESYKPTCVTWSPEVPAHWDIKPVAAAARVISEANQPALELLSVYLGRGVVRFSDVEEKRTNATSLDLSKYQVVRPGNLVLNNQQAWRGSVGVSKHTGIVSPAYIVLDLGGAFDHRFADYYFQTSTTVSHFLVSSKGVGTIQRNLYWPALRRCPITIPPLPEQRAIAAFLDNKCTKIDEAVRIKEEQITLLRERRQILIQQAVTRGLNPDAPMKDSGIDWIGEIPAHWGTRKLSHMGMVGNGSTPSRGNLAFWDTGNIPWLNSSKVNDFIIKGAEQFVTAKAKRECHLPSVEPGDLVMGITGQGKTRGMVAICEIKTTINQHLAYIRVKAPDVLNYYLLHFFSASYRWLRSQSDSSGSTKGAITCDDIKNYIVVVPPLLEQKAIVTHVENEAEKIDNAISIKQDQIAKLKEYKTSLINAAVTGKIKVI